MKAQLYVTLLFTLLSFTLNVSQARANETKTLLLSALQPSAPSKKPADSQKKPIKRTKTANTEASAPVEPVPTKIQRYLRSTYSMQNQEVHGHLRSDQGKQIPFRLSMRNNQVRYDFTNPKQRISLNLKEKGSQLRERTSKGTRPVSSRRYHQKIRGTEINYEDLGMRFLYWPRPGLLGTERIKFQKTWKLRVFNPNTLGPYRYVDVWVEQKSGAIMKMRGFDMKTGELIKEFKVVSVQKIDGGYMLKEMRIESYRPGESFPSARSYLSLENPHSIPTTR